MKEYRLLKPEINQNYTQLQLGYVLDDSGIYFYRGQDVFRFYIRSTPALEIEQAQMGRRLLPRW
jgi:hypothetical protein